ncbi:MAG: HNH endonuclease family protein, partial [Rivularia sp. (in: cyanobacteria)]
PKSVSGEAVNLFDKPSEYKNYVSKFGNLTLLEKTINTSVSDKYYELKKSGYRESQIFTTRSLAQKPDVGNNTQINRAIELLQIQQFDYWNSETIDKRQQILTNIAKRVWSLEAGNIDIWDSELQQSIDF